MRGEEVAECCHLLPGQSCWLKEEEEVKKGLLVGERESEVEVLGTELGRNE